MYRSTYARRSPKSALLDSTESTDIPVLSTCFLDSSATALKDRDVPTYQERFRTLMKIFGPSNTSHHSRLVMNTMVPLCSSPSNFRIIGEEILGRRVHGGGRSFVAFFGISPLKCHLLWQHMMEEERERRSDDKLSPRYLMWALLLLRTYNREEVLATMAGVDEKTFRKWAWKLVERLAQLQKLVSGGELVVL